MARALRGTDPKQAKPSKPKMLIFGEAGVGKSWFSLSFPSAYYIDTEGGANRPQYVEKLKQSGAAYFGPDQGSTDFAAVTEEIITLATTKHPYKTLIIDSYSQIFNSQVSADHERMERAGRDMEKTFGAEKKGAINWTRKWLRWFEKIDMSVLLIAHERTLWKDGKEAGATFDGHDKIRYNLDLVLQAVKIGPTRKGRVIKSRIASFPDAEMFDWTYEEFAARYGRDTIESDVQPVQLATTEQIDRYQKLLEVVKVDQATLDKWADNCDDLKELASEDIQKRINWLQGQIPKG